ncbi:uncharacterized protein LOC114759508 [Neltuma alba]|uniref:uncharacterized protein LOC114759502 n=1 Tax=Neltuma alba TaxID=207710 RepID=UPI0010A598D5|nr:uncharacterized protein LOC114759502 [Prosopis alba]XP_028804512.1 uncharacterized protein LOC114759502 [Prosopis alba]XP_028804513.1 uncharacterized protein LOC114759502 [Prosopis alba]XP_028804514.1 uncharacterized protein LOC114759502 [Prosopis alba]XP_028804517.1 uncharacterized protein LOC114759508 [Prosopis alba]XP_028804520.1 uncharacterized protein LOC114759508 [Prosopis alba]
MVRKRIPNLPVFTLKSPNLDSGSSLKAHATTSPISNKKSISSSQYKTIFLHDWWLVKPQGKGLAVGGVASMERLGERVISSSTIAKRHETNVLETQEGITFIITGFINKSRTNENGFSFEVCRRFQLGFPHDWEEYISFAVGGKHNNENTAADDLSTNLLKNAGEIVDLLTNKGDLNCSWLLNKLLNDSVGTSPQNISEQSVPGCNRERNIRMNTKGCQGAGDTVLGTSNLQGDQMHNIENGLSDAMLVAYGENPNSGLQSGMNMNSLKSSVGLPEKRTDKTPDSSEKMKNNPRSSVHKQKKSEDAGKVYCRRITRSISKMSHPAGRSQDDQMHNIENGVSNVVLEAQGENPNLGLQPGKNINSFKSRSEGLPGKRTNRAPDSSEKKKKYLRSSVPKQKKSEDVANFGFRRITRSISNLK